MPSPRLTGRDLVALLFIVLIWGSNFLAMKIAMQGFTPFQLGAGRYLFGLLPLVLLVPRPRLPWKWLVMYGLVQGLGQFGFLFVSLAMGMSTALASVLMQTQMFFTAAFSYLVLAEKPGKPLVLGMLLAAAGLACFALNYVGAQGDAAGGTPPLGLVLCLAGASMWGASNVIVRLAQRAAPAFDTLGFVVWCSVVPIVPFVLLSLAFDPPAARTAWLAASVESWLAVAYIGWGASIVAYTLWTKLIRRHGANRIAPFSLGMPVVGMACGLLLLGERLTAWQWAGIALTIPALAVVIVGGRRAAQ